MYLYGDGFLSFKGYREKIPFVKPAPIELEEAAKQKKSQQGGGGGGKKGKESKSQGDIVANVEKIALKESP